MNKILKLVYHDKQNFISYHDMKFTITIYDILSPIAHHYYVYGSMFHRTDVVSFIVTIFCVSLMYDFAIWQT